MLRSLIVLLALSLLGCGSYQTMDQLIAEERELLKLIEGERQNSQVSNAAATDPRPSAEARRPKVSPLATSLIARGWEQHGDWFVKALHDDMDVVTRVRLFTIFNRDRWRTHEMPGDVTLGLELIGGELIFLSNSLGLGGKHYWPLCESNGSTTSVDGGKAVRIATIKNAGACNSLDIHGDALAQFKSGETARVRMHYDNGSVSLYGFADAIGRARELSIK